MQKEALAAIAGEMNATPQTAARTDRHAPLVEETNALIRAAADALVTLDATPLSFQALKSESKPKS